ncbi:MAG TPA: hypothetical protein VHC41_03660, partial [Mycobacteriales bacterium]|nr:hypothetical protein [Mycobacteriales bacterium]
MDPTRPVAQQHEALLAFAAGPLDVLASELTITTPYGNPEVLVLSDRTGPRAVLTVFDQIGERHPGTRPHDRIGRLAATIWGYDRLEQLVTLEFETPQVFAAGRISGDVTKAVLLTSVAPGVTLEEALLAVRNARTDEARAQAVEVVRRMVVKIARAYAELHIESRDRSGPDWSLGAGWVEAAAEYVRDEPADQTLFDVLDRLGRLVQSAPEAWRAISLGDAHGENLRYHYNPVSGEERLTLLDPEHLRFTTDVDGAPLTGIAGVPLAGVSRFDGSPIHGDTALLQADLVATGTRLRVDTRVPGLTAELAELFGREYSEAVRNVPPAVRPRSYQLFEAVQAWQSARQGGSEVAARAADMWSRLVAVTADRVRSAEQQLLNASGDAAANARDTVNNARLLHADAVRGRDVALAAVGQPVESAPQSVSQMMISAANRWTRVSIAAEEAARASDGADNAQYALETVGDVVRELSRLQQVSLRYSNAIDAGDIGAASRLLGTLSDDVRGVNARVAEDVADNPALQDLLSGDATLADPLELLSAKALQLTTVDGQTHLDTESQAVLITRYRATLEAAGLIGAEVDGEVEGFARFLRETPAKAEAVQRMAADVLPAPAERTPVGEALQRLRQFYGTRLVVDDPGQLAAFAILPAVLHGRIAARAAAIGTGVHVGARPTAAVEALHEGYSGDSSGELRFAPGSPSIAGLLDSGTGLEWDLLHQTVLSLTRHAVPVGVRTEAAALLAQLVIGYHVDRAGNAAPRKRLGLRAMLGADLPGTVPVVTVERESITVATSLGVTVQATVDGSILVNSREIGELPEGVTVRGHEIELAAGATVVLGRGTVTIRTVDGTTTVLRADGSVDVLRDGQPVAAIGADRTLVHASWPAEAANGGFTVRAGLSRISSDAGGVVRVVVTGNRTPEGNAAEDVLADVEAFIEANVLRIAPDTAWLTAWSELVGEVESPMGALVTWLDAQRPGTVPAGLDRDVISWLHQAWRTNFTGARRTGERDGWLSALKRGRDLAADIALMVDRWREAIESLPAAERFAGRLALAAAMRESLWHRLAAMGDPLSEQFLDRAQHTGDALSELFLTAAVQHHGYSLDPNRLAEDVREPGARDGVTIGDIVRLAVPGLTGDSLVHRIRLTMLEAGRRQPGNLDALDTRAPGRLGRALRELRVRLRVAGLRVLSPEAAAPVPARDATAILRMPGVLARAQAANEFARAAEEGRAPRSTVNEARIVSARTQRDLSEVGGEVGSDRAVGTSAPATEPLGLDKAWAGPEPAVGTRTARDLWWSITAAEDFWVRAAEREPAAAGERLIQLRAVLGGQLQAFAAEPGVVRSAALLNDLAAEIERYNAQLRSGEPRLLNPLGLDYHTQRTLVRAGSRYTRDTQILLVGLYRALLAGKYADDLAGSVAGYAMFVENTPAAADFDGRSFADALGADLFTTIEAGRRRPMSRIHSPRLTGLYGTDRIVFEDATPPFLVGLLENLPDEIHARIAARLIATGGRIHVGAGEVRYVGPAGRAAFVALHEGYSRPAGSDTDIAISAGHDGSADGAVRALGRTIGRLLDDIVSAGQGQTMRRSARWQALAKALRSLPGDQLGDKLSPDEIFDLAIGAHLLTISADEAGPATSARMLGLARLAFPPVLRLTRETVTVSATGGAATGAEVQVGADRQAVLSLNDTKYELTPGAPVPGARVTEDGTIELADGGEGRPGTTVTVDEAGVTVRRTDGVTTVRRADGSVEVHTREGLLLSLDENFTVVVADGPIPQFDAGVLTVTTQDRTVTVTLDADDVLT